MNNSDHQPPVPLPVFMCTWRRPHLLERTIELLLSQEGIAPHFFLWNNNKDIARVVDGVAARYRGRLRITIRHNDTNVGPFGRFLFARAMEEPYEYVAIIDDDQRFDERFLETLWNERIQGGVVASHAAIFKRGGFYWDRVWPAPGERVNYCGPGGMILHTGLLGDPRLWQCPPRYRFLDDIWVSYVFDHLLRATIRRSSAKVTMTDLNNDTWINVRRQKEEFLSYLRRRGWDV